MTNNIQEFIKNIAQGNLQEAKENILKELKESIQNRLKETKMYMVAQQNESFEDTEISFDADSEDFEDSDTLEEGNPNVIRMGRTKTIRRQVRRDASGRMIIKRNARRSTVSGFRISGKSMKRISATEKFRRSQNLKRAWRSSRRAKLSRSLLKRKMSILRRQSLGIR